MHPRLSRLIPMVVATLFFVSIAWQTHADPVTKAAVKKPNALQTEMRLLEKAMLAGVSGVARGDVRALPSLLHKAHMAGAQVKKDLKSGVYVLPLQANNVAGFVALDAEFHQVMFKMVKSAKKNDVTMTAKHLGTLMNRCNVCHVAYRGPM